MSNLLAGVNRWTDYGDNRPPLAVLDGAFYLAPVPGDGVYLEQTAYTADSTINIGDTVTGAATFQWDDAIALYLQCGTASDRDQFGSVLLAKGASVPFDFTVSSSPGAGVHLSLATGPGGGSVYVYGLGYDFRQAAPVVPTCEELGRATRNYVSAYSRDRVHYSSLYAPEVRCLVTDFNGAIPPGRSIVSATWQTWETLTCVMASPEVSARSVQVRITAQYAGRARILVTATLDNGEVYTAWHMVRVNPAPYFSSSPSWMAGPRLLTANAP